jgi:hypothetical protein
LCHLGIALLSQRTPKNSKKKEKANNKEQSTTQQTQKPQSQQVQTQKKAQKPEQREKPQKPPGPYDNEILVSKFHRATTVHSVWRFLVKNGLNPKKVELVKKESSQWFNAFVTLPPEEVKKALDISRAIYYADKRTVNFMPSRRNNWEKKYGPESVTNFPEKYYEQKQENKPQQQQNQQEQPQSQSQPL